MAHSRGAGLVSVVMASVAAAALTGVAVLTVATAGCDQPGYYVQSGAHTELVGGCLRPAELPAGNDGTQIIPARPAAVSTNVQP